MPFDQSRIIEKAKFTYSLLGKAFEKQTKIIEDQGGKQIDVVLNKKRREVVLFKIDGKSLYFQEIFEEPFRERFE